MDMESKDIYETQKFHLTGFFEIGSTSKIRFEEIISLSKEMTTLVSSATQD
jgi:hypothetical protein